jgi:Rrf2 family protein
MFLTIPMGLVIKTRIVKLSNKGRYGIRALFDIAYFHDGTATQIKDIAERQSIPPRFLEQIFQELKRAGLVVSKRGPKGGYQLNGEPAAIRIGDVIRSLEGPVTLFGATDDEPASPPTTAFHESGARPLHIPHNPHTPRNPSAACATKSATTQTVTEEIFAELATKVEACLDSVTLQDLCERAERQGVPRKVRHAYSYAI